jgi:hypothetical protein
MNSLASPKYAKRLLMALAAISGIFLTVACGSNPITQPNNQGFTNSSLNGTYVFSSQGADSSGNVLTLAGALVANGSGGITGGTMDVVDSGVTPPTPIAQAITGSYSVSTDGRGQAKLSSTAYGTFVLGFVLSSSSHGLVAEFDGNGTGSGTIDLQTSVTNISQFAGPYAFSFSGIDANSNPLATAGSFTLDSSGNTTAGVQDFNDSGIPYPAQSLTGTASLGSGTGPGSMTLSSVFGPLTFDFYPIDATHMKFIETDFSFAILSGDVFTQTGAAVPTGPMVFTMAGGVSGPIANGGLMTSDGTGNFTNGLEDINNTGSVSQVPLQFTGTKAAGGSVGGRVIVNLTGFAPATAWVIYPSGGGLLLLELDTQTVTLGAAYAQTATSFAASEGYGLNLSGENAIPAVVNDIAQFNATSPTASPNMSGALDDNESGSLASNLPLSGTYTPDSPATGRGSIVVPNLGTSNGGLGLEYYVVNNSTTLFIEVDPNQVAVGSFGQQSTPGGQEMLHPVVSILRSTGQSHGASKSKHRS